MDILKLKNIYKTYNNGKIEFKALKDVSLTIKHGEFVLILGESGSGKTTLLNIIGAIDTPSSGKVLISETDISTLPDDEKSIFRRRNIGFIFQFFNLIPELTVEENIIFPLLLDNKPVDECYLIEIMSTLNLKSKKDSLPDELSGGQQQRVAIARALITRPILILADEPTGNLDSKNSREIISLLKSCSKKYKQTIIMITHNSNLVSVADRIFYVSDGFITDMVK